MAPTVSKLGCVPVANTKNIFLELGGVVGKDGSSNNLKNVLLWLHLLDLTASNER